MAIDLGLGSTIAARTRPRPSRGDGGGGELRGHEQLSHQREHHHGRLGYVRSNLDASYTDPEWQALSQTCTDPERVAFDIGGGTQVTFQPMSQPSAWGPGTLDCVSKASSYLRVRVPDQSIDTSFAKILGFDTLTAHGATVAILTPGTTLMVRSIWHSRWDGGREIPRSSGLGPHPSFPGRQCWCLRRDKQRVLR